MLGYFQDIASKLSYVRARFLRTDLARWLTVDPLWPSQPSYTYVVDQPTVYTDPTGLWKTQADFGVCSHAYMSENGQFPFDSIYSWVFRVCFCDKDANYYLWHIAGLTAVIDVLLAALALFCPTCAPAATVAAVIVTIIGYLIGSLIAQCQRQSTVDGYSCIEVDPLWNADFQEVPPYYGLAGLKPYCCQCLQKSKGSGSNT